MAVLPRWLQSPLTSPSKNDAKRASVVTSCAKGEYLINPSPSVVCSHWYCSTASPCSRRWLWACSDYRAVSAMSS